MEHYIKQLRALKDLFGPNAKLAVLDKHGKKLYLGTEQEVINWYNSN